MLFSDKENIHVMNKAIVSTTTKKAAQLNVKVFPGNSTKICLNKNEGIRFACCLLVTCLFVYT